MRNNFIRARRARGGLRKTCSRFVQRNGVQRNGGQRYGGLIALFIVLSGMLSITGCVGATGASTQKNQTTPAAAAISVSPPSIGFGSVAIGGTVSQSVTISNTGGSNLTVTQATTAANGFTITGISLPLIIGAGSQSTFNVVFAPKALGAVPGAVSIVSDAASSPSSVSISGTGVAATALLNSSAPSLSFGNVSAGAGSTLGVSLTNAGNSNVTISGVTVSGTTFTVNGVSSGLILALGQNATLNVTFSPVAAGNFTGSITVASNATNSPAVISLSGAGTLAGSHSVTLGWTASTSVVAGYNIYRSAGSGGPYTKLNSSAVAQTSYTDSTVQAGDTYYYMITSVTAAGVEGVDSAQASAVIPKA